MPEMATLVEVPDVLALTTRGVPDGLATDAGQRRIGVHRDGCSFAAAGTASSSLPEVRNEMQSRLRGLPDAADADVVES
jgi:hypothetical protein